MTKLRRKAVEFLLTLGCLGVLTVLIGLVSAARLKPSRHTFQVVVLTGFEENGEWWIEGTGAKCLPADRKIEVMRNKLTVFYLACIKNEKMTMNPERFNIRVIAPAPFCRVSKSCGLIINEKGEYDVELKVEMPHSYIEPRPVKVHVSCYDRLPPGLPQQT